MGMFLLTYLIPPLWKVPSLQVRSFTEQMERER